MKKRFKVVALHFTQKCNFNCSFCYREGGEKTMDEKLFLGLPKYLSQITDQVALGGGEPTLFPELVSKFAEKCKKYGLVCNVTTNGYAIRKWSDEKVKRFSENLTMVSVSLDREKIRQWSLDEYLKVAKKLQKYTLVGCNLLIDEDMFKNADFIRIVASLFHEGLDRVFALYPKNAYSVGILPYKNYYLYLSTVYPKFYVDDLTYKILDEEKYSDWEKPCHYGKDIISINEKGEVTGCSFCNSHKLILKKPEDILKDIVFEDRFSCPYLAR